MTHHLPFSNDYEREEAFALGVINGKSAGFPDTLRQFRIPGPAPRMDSLTPLTQGSEPPGALPPPKARRFASLTVSLAVGFGVGVAIAFAAVALRAPREVPQPAATAPVAPPASTPTPAAHPEPAPRVVTTPSASAQSAPSAPKTSLVTVAAPAMATPEQDRRWLLELARSEQRRYRIAAAERLYRQILARAPQDSEALSGLGELDLLRGTVDLADEHFQAALSANANYIPALIAAADIRWQSGRAEEARQAYRDIVDHYSADLYPPYVALRSVPAATPVCER